jgi:hypothetical protein
MTAACLYVDAQHRVAVGTVPALHIGSLVVDTQAMWLAGSVVLWTFFRMYLVDRSRS